LYYVRHMSFFICIIHVLLTYVKHMTDFSPLYRSNSYIILKRIFY
jgi:hypothetical protein